MHPCSWDKDSSRTSCEARVTAGSIRGVESLSSGAIAVSSPYDPPRSETLDPSLRSTRKYHVAVILSGIFGVLGIQHFYLARWGLGLIDLSLSIGAFAALVNDEVVLAALLFGTDCVHTLVITIMLLTGSFRDGDGKLVTYPGQKLPGEQESGHPTA